MDNPFSLKGKTILVTGASSGIGSQCAISASNMGANIILVARNRVGLEKTYAKLNKGSHVIIEQDVTEYKKIDEMVKKSVEQSGKIYGFIHSAGIEITMPFKMMKPSHYEKLFSINVISGLEIAKTISKKKYIDEQGGSFVFISSIMGSLGQIGKVGYCSSKSALISGVKAMALELVPNRIRVNCILPGCVEDTPMATKLLKSLSDKAKQSVIGLHPLGLGKPDDVANACVYLLSDASKWVTGIGLKVDGGYSAQ